MSTVLAGPRANRRVTWSQLPNDRSESVLVANPTNPLNMVGASKRFTDPASYVFTLATYATFDGGLSWIEAPPPATPGWGLLSDPGIAWDDAGNVYLIGLPLVRANVFVGIAVYKSTDGGRTWGPPRLIHRVKERQVDDKPWAAGDTSPTSPHKGNLYVIWVGEGPDNEGPGFARSSDHGTTWKGAGDHDAGTPLFATEQMIFSLPELSVAADGTVYIVWLEALSNGIQFVKSTDGGSSFTAPRMVASPVSVPASHHLPGATFRAESAPTGCTAGGNIVVFAWPDFSLGTSRIFYRRSLDGGATWLGSAAGDPLLTGAAASAAGQHECLPQIISMPSGEIGCAFYEFGPKGPAGRNLIDVVLAVSTDQGATFPHRVTVTDRAWDPTVAEVVLPSGQRETFIGDYFGLEATRLGFFPFWTDTRTGVQEIYAARVALNPADLALRDTAADTGDPATAANPDAAWEAPDLIVRRQRDGETTFVNQEILADGRTDHFIYGRVRNRGDNAAVNARLSVVVASYPPVAGLPGAEFSYPQDWYAGDWDSPALQARHRDLGESPAKSVAAGATEILGPVVWPAAQIPPRSTFPCLLAEVRADNDDSAGGADGGDLQAVPSRAGAFFWGNNNVCQRNLTYAASFDLLIRDGVDDSGEPGSVAWGGRSPDIIVTQSPADPPADFADLGDPQPGEPLRAGTNRIFVRVHNRGPARVSAVVDLFFAPADTPWTWPSHPIASGLAVAGIDPGSFRFTPETAWTPPASSPHVLVAVARHESDPPPALPSATDQDLHRFWTFFLTDVPAVPSAQVALRALPFAA